MLRSLRPAPARVRPGAPIAVAVAALLASAPARADRIATPPTAPATPASGDVIGLLDVRVEGVSPTAAELFVTQIEESLEMSGLKVALRKRLHEYLAGTAWNSACLMGACLSELWRRADVATVIEVALVTTGPSYHYVVTLLDTATGRTVTQIARKCDVCTTDEAFAAAALAVVELVSGVGEAAPPTGPPAVEPALIAAQARVASARRRARWVGIGLVAGAVATGVGSYLFYDRDREGLGGAAAGAAGALGIAGAASLGLSLSF